MAMELQTILGQRPVAFACGVRSPKLVGRWARGDCHPRETSELRLRLLYRVVLTLKQREADQTVRAWLVAANGGLGDEAALEVIRDRPGMSVVHAAEAFIDA